jgi:hypothetical protein
MLRKYRKARLKAISKDYSVRYLTTGRWLLIAVLGVLLLLGSGAVPKAETLESDEVQLSFRRYRKGISLMRTLYEKLLALDHHFSGANTDWNWQRPVRAIASTGDLTPLQGENQREELVELMYRQVYREMMYLRIRNESLLQDCKHLFVQYTSVVDYHTNLELTRGTDNWEALEAQIDLLEQNWGQAFDKDPNSQWRKHIDIEFSVDRVLDFLNRYLDHVRDCRMHFQALEKWAIQERQYHSVDPHLQEDWKWLERQVRQALLRFESAYALPEIEGSRLKDLLYGFSDD